MHNPTPRELLEQMAASEGTTVSAIAQNAKRKQYDMGITVKITESGTQVGFFDTTVQYTGLPFSNMVIIEHALLEILNKLQALSEEIMIPGRPDAPPSQP